MSDAKEVFLADGKSAGVWYCSKCKLVRKTENEAEKCCQPYTCSVCGRETTRFVTTCGSCRHAEYAARNQERMDQAELVDEYDGWVWSPDVIGERDGYFCDVGSLIGECEDDDIEIPEFAHCCKPVPIRVTIEDVTSRLDNNGWDGMLEYVIGMKELEEAIEIFNELNADICVAQQCDWNRKVRVAQQEIQP